MAFSSIRFFPAASAWQDEISGLLRAYLKGERLFLGVESTEQLKVFSKFFAETVCRFSFPFSLTEKRLSSFNLEVCVGAPENLPSFFPFAAWESSPAEPPVSPPDGCDMDTLLYRAFYLIEQEGVPAREMILLTPASALCQQMKSRLKEIYRGYFSLTGDVHFLEQAAVHGNVSILTPEEYFLYCCNQFAPTRLYVCEDSSSLSQWIAVQIKSLLARYPYLLDRYSLSLSSFCRGFCGFFLSLCAQGYDLYCFTRTQLGDCADQDLSQFLSALLLRLAKGLPAFQQKSRITFPGLLPSSISYEKRFLPRHILAYPSKERSLEAWRKPAASAPSADPSPVLLREPKQIPLAINHLAAFLPGSIGIFTETEEQAERLGAMLPFPVASQTSHLARTLPALDFAAWLENLSRNSRAFASLPLPVLVSRFSPRANTPFYLSRWERVSAWLCEKIPHSYGPEALAFLQRAVEDPLGVPAAFSGEKIILGSSISLMSSSYDWLILPYSPSVLPPSLFLARISQDGQHIGYVFSPSRRKQLFSRYYTRNDHLRRYGDWLRQATSCAKKGVYLLQIPDMPFN